MMQLGLGSLSRGSSKVGWVGCMSLKSLDTCVQFQRIKNQTRLVSSKRHHQIKIVFLFPAGRSHIGSSIARWDKVAQWAMPVMSKSKPKC